MRPTAQVDVVVPYTGQELTASTIAAAEKLGSGLGATIRVLCLEPVPYRMELSQPRVNLDFLRRKLQALPSSRPFHSEIVLTRDEDEALLRRLHTDSVVVLTSRRHFWRTAWAFAWFCFRRTRNKCQTSFTHYSSRRSSFWPGASPSLRTPLKESCGAGCHPAARLLIALSVTSQ
jgi:hypothetical protein